MTTRDECIENATSDLVAQMDRSVRCAVYARLGQWLSDQQLAARMKRQTFGGFDTFYLDDKPLIRFHPVKIDDSLEATVARFTRQVELLLPTEAPPG